MRAVIAEDAVLLREGLARLLDEGGFEVVDCVADGEALLRAVEKHQPDVCVVDIRMPPTFSDEGVRAALVWNEDTARLARQHNNANVISVGARMHPEADALRFVEAFLQTPFSEDPRHERRIAMLAEYEATGAIAGHQTA